MSDARERSACTGSLWDRRNPTIADVLRHDVTLPISDQVRALAARDLTGWSHRVALPVARAASLALVFFVRTVKTALPFQFRWHAAIDWLGLWFLRRFVSPSGVELLMRHFVVETNLLAFIASNCGAPLEAPRLRPHRLADLGDGAVITHDVNVYNLVIDVGLSGADMQTPRPRLDFSALEVPSFDVERSRRRWLELDVETAMYLMNIPFCLFTTGPEYERAVNSFQLDESVCAMLAGLTGDPVFRTWTPLKFPLWISVRRDVPKELFWHAVVCEYAHTRLEQLRAEQEHRDDV
jgi:hypothetical protein